MNRKKLAILIGICFLVILFLMKKENPSTQHGIKRKVVKEVSDTVINSRIDTALYIRIGNPDTALVFFLYKNFNKYDYDSQREEYIRWDLEKEELRPLFTSLFKNRSNYYLIIDKLERNSITFIEDARRAVLDEYNTYYTITDLIEFEYLLQKKDTVFKEILWDVRRDKRVPFEERVKVKALLKRW